MTVNLLDLDYYRRVNPDLADFTDEEATEHFFNVGLREGRIASTQFEFELFSSLTDRSFMWVRLGFAIGFPTEPIKIYKSIQYILKQNINK